MLPATQEEIDHVTGYMTSQAPDRKVQFLQKVYSENVLHVWHDVWDVHTDADRWWAITEPMNLYAQEQFPNMDLALTFHVGLCLRIPRSERQKLSELPVEPFAECYRHLQEASEALQQSSEVADYQAIGVVPDRCPACGSQRLAPQRGYNTNFSDVEWERPVCEKCGWAGLPVSVTNIADAPDEPPPVSAEGECVIPTVPLRQLKHPSDPS